MSLRTSLISHAARALAVTRAGRMLILIYHRVLPKRDPLFPFEVTAQTFGWQIELLRRYCSPMSLQDGIQRLREGSLPARAIAVTFDDGYQDNATVALPILQQYGVPATFFVAPGFLNGGLMWNDAIIESIRHARSGEIDLNDVGLGTGHLDGDEERGAVANRVIRAVKHLRPDERAERVRRICEGVGVPAPRDLMMTSAQVRHLAQAGMEIGAHTLTHPILKTLNDAQARSEIEGSRSALEAIVGATVRGFAYPNGRPEADYTLRDRDLVRLLGFDYAVSTLGGVATRDTDIFQLPRFTPWDQTPARWLGRLLLAFRNAA